ncbi:uncharacterized protein [Nicotiana sylvestris]|uniref:uncharacterized protein n=1 Tax=Nicotiana sylvestris TaxID=4096 RepID=UPI00388C38CC
MYKALYEQKDEVLRDTTDLSALRAKLEKAQKEAKKAKQDYALLVQKVYEKITLIDQLRTKMNEVKATADELRDKMDRLASEQDATKEDLALTKEQLQVMKDKVEKWSQLNEELRAQLTSVVAEHDTVSQEYTALKSKLEVASSEISGAQDILAQYMADIEIAEARIITKTEYVRWLSPMEAFEEIPAREVSVAAKIEEGNMFEAEAKVKYHPEEPDSELGSDED